MASDHFSGWQSEEEAMLREALRLSTMADAPAPDELSAEEKTMLEAPHIVCLASSPSVLCCHLGLRFAIGVW